MPNPFAPPPDRELLPAEQIKPVYEHWRVRQLYSVFFGYVLCYLVRKNISMAIPDMEKSFSKADLGKIISSSEIVYGVSKFTNGVAADRSDARKFMVCGLVFAGLANLAFGWSATLPALAFWWMVNNWFQGMGFPPCARVLSNWYSVSERGSWWSLWATSQQVGAALAVLLSTFLVQAYGWRSVFLIPGTLVLIGAAFIWNRMRDKPGSLGLPPVDVYRDEARSGERADNQVGASRLQREAPTSKKEVDVDLPQSEETYAQLLMTRVFTNPYIWLVSIANFFVYVLRGTFLYWGPTYLIEVKHMSMSYAGGCTAGFEFAGLFGTLASGWISDRWMKGKRAHLCVIFMLGAAAAVAGFARVPDGALLETMLMLFAVGFFIYGPQCMVAVIAADLASKEAAATAVGVTGIFAYASGIVTGYGTGKLVDVYGWNICFEMMVGYAILSALFFATCWKSKARVD